MRLRAEGLSIDRGGRRVIRATSFALEAGEALLVTGPNGAGKSTLLRAIAGLLPLAAGSVHLAPSAGFDRDASLSERSHYLGHADAAKAALSVRENLEFWAALLGSRHRPAHSVEEALTRLDLSRLIDVSAGLLSAGQRRRVALARLLMTKRPLWLLDEPQNALDSRALDCLLDMAKEHLAGGGIIVAATHTPLPIEPGRALRLGGGP
jgi:heme exporter protein A